MGFKEDVQKLSAQIAERRDHVVNEEMGKQVLIIPFLKVLGFDVYNPLEVRPEYTSDFGKKKGEKVDYAVFKDGTPLMFIEAKALAEDLGSHDSQLARYFNATPQIRLAILTNGVVYKFFTDLNTTNVMDVNPFLVIDMTDLSLSDIEVLDNFRRDRFETDSLVKYAEELIYTSNINAKLKDLFRNPPDDFIRYLIKDFSDTRITSNVLDRFRPIVKKSISVALLEIMSQNLFPQETPDSDPQAEQNQPLEAAPDNGSPVENSKGVTTTAEELASLAIVKSLLERNNRDISEVTAKDTTMYYGIHVKSVTRWFIRLNLDSAAKQVITRLPLDQIQPLAQGFKVEPAPKGIGESRVFINSYSDLAKLEELIVLCFDCVTS